MSPDTLPSRIGGCELGEMLGQGGVGAVYRATQLSLARAVAVKILLSQHVQDKAYVERFLLEAKTVATLSHQNIVQVHDAGREGDLYYMVMEFVTGRSLGARVRDAGPMAVKDAVTFVAQAARGLSAAHAKGLIHRDIKPDNIMVTEDGTAKVADFGLAKSLESEVMLTRTGTIVGSPAFMSPEQCEGEKLEPATDIYSLGATLWCVLVGRPPFEGSSPTRVMIHHLETPPESPRKLRPEVPAPVSDFILKMMAKRPAHRPPSMKDVADRLEAFLRGEGRTSETSTTAPTLLGAPKTTRMFKLAVRPPYTPKKIAIFAGSVGVLVLTLVLAFRSGSAPAGPGTTPPGPNPVIASPGPGPNTNGDGAPANPTTPNPPANGGTPTPPTPAPPTNTDPVPNPPVENPSPVAPTPPKESPEPALAAARKALGEQDWDRAREAAEKAASLGATAAAQEILGKLARYGEAMQAVKAARAKGDLEGVQKQLKEAAKAIDSAEVKAALAAVEKYPDFVRQGNKALGLEKWEEAFQAYDAALAVVESDKIRGQWREAAYHVHFEKGKAEEAAGRLKEAHTEYLRARSYKSTPEVDEAIQRVEPKAKEGDGK